MKRMMIRNDYDKTFKDRRAEVSPNSTRAASGWIIYQQTDKEPTVSSSQGRCLTLTQMIDRLVLKPKPQPTPKRIHRTQPVSQPIPGPTPTRY